MKNRVDTLDGTPHKRFILSIVSDYDLPRSICELVDNALDLWIKSKNSKTVKVDISFDQRQKTITITDDAGGVAQDQLEYLISPGATSNSIEDMTIGIFGVGTKRAVIALSEDIKITSRHKKQRTFSIEYDKHWLNDDTWQLDYYEVDKIPEGSTIVELQKLRIEINDEIIDGLKEKLSATYAHFISTNALQITVDGRILTPIQYENWAYPPGYEPRKYKGTIIVKDAERRKVEVEVTAGLTRESSPATGEYGVYFYCNDRLIVANLKSPEVGFIKGIAGQPHPSISITRVIITLRGSARDMPWNSSKSGINVNHHTFIELRNWLFEIVKNFTSLARRLEGDWEDKVFKYDTGRIVETDVKVFTPQKQYLIDLPPVNKKMVDVVKSRNARIQKIKPWTLGIMEGVIAVDYVGKQRLTTKNRISLILLDSTLEISFKEFLVNESGNYYKDSDLSKIFEKRHMVIAEIKKFVSDVSDDDWKKVKYYNDLRNKIIHERATVEILSEQVADFRKVVERLTHRLFKLKF